MGFIFKQVRAEGGCLSFIIGDQVSHRACIIDPRADQQDIYEEFLAARKLTATLVFDTHTHADHYSGSHLVAQNLGARIAMSASTKSARPDLKLVDGQIIEVGGGLAVRALATSGHTPDSMTFLVQGDWGQTAFTGDTLFIGGSGRTDFPGADPSAQFDSIHGKLGALPDSSWVLPGHDYSDLLFSTIGHEKRTNPHWLISSRDEFVRVKNAEALDSPGVLTQVVSFNLDAKPRSFPRGGAMTMCATVAVKPQSKVERLDAANFRQLLAEQRAKGAIFIDVREPEEFARFRIADTVNIPTSELLMHWKELKSASAVYFLCDRGSRSLVAAESVQRLGLDKVGDLAAGTSGWVATGNAVVK
ncbi:MAG: MBL fold metallo-hydrolase [Deltaproteobacteria bacterium]|nr:MBL fold metallo-hydrolase [Deltaproteobacteria bacterium]